MNLTNIHNAYFIGIGGIGMSAIARWLMRRGVSIAGYDRVKTPLTEKLVEEGMDIHFEDDPDRIPASFLNQSTLWVYTPAIPQNHQEINYLKTLGVPLYKRSEVLAEITLAYPTIAVAGTHGKTTTTTLLAHLLYEGGVNFTGILGGIAAGYDSNLIEKSGEGDPLFVVEADEYDRSFLRLHPSHGIITAIDPDHLDIYGDTSEVEKAYQQFAGQVKTELWVQSNYSERILAPHKTYSVDAGDAHATQVEIREGAYHFTYQGEKHRIEDIKTNLPGRHNIENAVAAITMALSAGVKEEMITEGMKSFRGIKRRFEFVHSGNITLIDDYAHHPREIESFLAAVKSLFPNKHLTVIFQPHLYTRTRDFAGEFADALSVAERIVLLDIYPAREEPIAGVSSSIIAEKVNVADCKVIRKEHLLKATEEWNPAEVICTIGAGNIDALVRPLKEKLLDRYEEVE